MVVHGLAERRREPGLSDSFRRRDLSIRDRGMAGRRLCGGRCDRPKPYDAGKALASGHASQAAAVRPSGMTASLSSHREETWWRVLIRASEKPSLASYSQRCRCYPIVALGKCTRRSHLRKVNARWRLDDARRSAGQIGVPGLLPRIEVLDRQLET
jgi:hypothetical protein